jgi:cold-inducible RNA-binding protein
VTNIFIRNLDPSTTKAQLYDLFTPYGWVESVTIVKDRDTDEPRGLAFVEMSDAMQAHAAIRSLNGSLLNQQVIQMNEARDKQPHDGNRDSSREHRRHKI